MRSRLTQRRVVAVAYCVITFVSIMDATIVNVALPSVGRHFEVQATSADGVVIGYLAGLAMFIPVSGWLGDAVGSRRLFLGAMAGFTCASAACALAPSVVVLILVRAIQGAAAGLLMPVGLTMLFRQYTDEDRIRISRILMAPTVVAPASGPIVGGFLVDQLSWRWCFWVNVPIGIAGLAFAGAFLAHDRAHHPGRFDLPGFALACCGLAATMYAISAGPLLGWASVAVFPPGVLGLLLLAALIPTELGRATPMLDLRLFRRRHFACATGVAMLGGIAFSGVLYLMPVFLQDARHASALSSGLTTFPEAIGVVVSTQLVARVLPRVGPRVVMAGGQLWVALMIFGLALVNLQTPRAIVMALMFLIGAGMATDFLPSQTMAFEGLTPRQTSSASTLYNAGGRASSALGVALVSTVVNAIGAVALNGHPRAGAYHAAMILAGSAPVCGIAVALGLPRSRAPGDRSPTGLSG